MNVTPPMGRLIQKHHPAGCQSRATSQRKEEAYHTPSSLFDKDVVNRKGSVLGDPGGRVECGRELRTLV